MLHNLGLTVRAWTLLLFLGIPAAVTADDRGLAAIENSLRATEIAFAKTMADRDQAAFVAFLSSDAIFFRPRRSVAG